MEKETSVTRHRSLALFALVAGVWWGTVTWGQVIEAQTEATSTPSAIPDDSAISTLILETLQDDPPRSVDQQLEAVRILLNINQDARALDYLKAVAAMPLSADELRRLHTHFGSVYFLELAADPRVADVAQELLNRIFEAVRAETTPPPGVNDQIAQLISGNAEQIRIAHDSLRNSGDWGVVALLQALVSSQAEPTARSPLQAALIELGPLHPEPLLAAARSSDEQTRQVAIDAMMAMNLDNMTATRALPLLIARQAAVETFGVLDEPAVPGTLDRAEWRQPLSDEIRRLWNRANSRTDTTVLWFWDRQTNKAIPREMTGQIADYVVASQIAEDWMAIDPNAEEAHELYLGSVLAALQLSHGLDRAIPDVAERRFATTSPSDRVGRVLNLALQERMEGAAVAACQILALQGNPFVLTGDSPLIRALRDPNPRIRFAALLASSQLAPQATIAGAADLWNEAWRTLATRGERRVMIVDPNGQRGAAVASLASQAGWTVTVTGDTRECIRLLRQNPDFEFVLIHDDLSTPPWTELVQQLQFDHWTAGLPIAVLYDVDKPRRATVALGGIEQFPVPSDAVTWESLVHRVFPEGVPSATAFRRLERARQIRPWALRVAQNRAWQPVHGIESVDPHLFHGE